MLTSSSRKSTSQNLEAAKALESKIEDIAIRLTAQMQGLQTGLQVIFDAGALEDDANNQSLRAWRLTDPRDDRKRIENDKDPLLEGSCAWIFNDPAFTRWWDDDDCRVLWIHGDPGKGKTLMTMAIIDEISRRLELSPDSRILSYFFCQSTIPDLSNANAIVRGLTFLLCSQKPDLGRYLWKKYGETGDRLFEGANSLYSIWGTLVELLQDAAVHRHYLMIDALDECDAKSMETFLRLLNQEVPRLSTVKWVLTSRNEQRITEHLQHAQKSRDTSLELNSINVERTVQSFIDFKMDILKSRKEYDNKLDAYVRRHLKENADGTFLWVSLVCKELERVQARKAREACSRFPAGLVPLYQRMMEQIEQGDNVEELKQVLRTITVACRPLDLSEMGVIAGLSEGLSSEGQDWQNIRDLISSCRSFLTAREQTVDFVHKSAKDYFTEGEGSRIFPDGQSFVHCEFSSRLLGIMSDSLRKDICRIGTWGTTLELVDKNAIYRYFPRYLQYACCFWVEHVHKGQYRLEDNGRVHVFLQKYFLYWLEALSLIKRVVDAIPVLVDLQRLLKVNNHCFCYQCTS